MPEIDIDIVDSGDHSSQVPALNGNKVTGQFIRIFVYHCMIGKSEPEVTLCV